MKKKVLKARDDAMTVSDPRSDLRTEWSDGEGSGGCRLLSEHRGQFCVGYEWSFGSPLAHLQAQVYPLI